MFFCISCEKKFYEDDMVIYSFQTMNGFCRECSRTISYEELMSFKVNDYEKDG